MLGDNSVGQLGNNTTTDSSFPVQVNGLTSGVTVLTAGESHTCALVNGAAECWGLNGGDFGNNTTTPSLVPVPVLGL